MNEIFVRDEEIPKNCAECKYLTEACGGRFCRIGDIVPKIDMPRTKRHESCPLQPATKIYKEMRIEFRKRRAKNLEERREYGRSRTNL